LGLKPYHLALVYLEPSVVLFVVCECGNPIVINDQLESLLFSAALNQTNLNLLLAQLKQLGLEENMIVNLSVEASQPRKIICRNNSFGVTRFLESVKSIALAEVQIKFVLRDSLHMGC
jgi:hypothetical protein